VATVGRVDGFERAPRWRVEWGAGQPSGRGAHGEGCAVRAAAWPDPVLCVRIARWRA